MKKTVVIFSLILITILSVGSFFIHCCYLTSYKKEFRAFLLNQQCRKNYTLLQINPSQLYSNNSSLQWKDENKEVVYKNKLYDIVSINFTGTTITLMLVSDEQETNLKQQFASMFDVGALQQTKTPLHILKRYLDLKCIINSLSFNNRVIEVCANSCFTTYNCFIYQVVISCESPPPELRLYV